MKFLILILACLFAAPLAAQSDSTTVRIHFFYGSRPGSHTHEQKRFGGIHGGHVSMQIDDTLFSFRFKGKVRLWGTRKNPHHHWEKQPLSTWVLDTIGNQYATVMLPLSSEQFRKLKSIEAAYCAKDPYDYAFLGMRCASSMDDVCAQLGLFKPRSRWGMIVTNFYPKRFRIRLFKLASRNQWEIIGHAGSASRRWER